MSTNTITVDGYLSKDGELKFTQSGSAFLRLTIPDNKQTRDDSGNWKDVDGYTTTWFSVTVWGKEAELLSEKAVKGAKVKATGRLVSRTWETKEGEQRVDLELDYPAVRIDEKRDRGGQQSSRSQQGSPAQGDPWGASQGGNAYDQPPF